MSLRISLLTIETSNADPALMAVLRELLERAGAAGAVVVTEQIPEAAPPVAPTPTRARGKRKAPVAACATFPPCRGCRVGGACVARPAVPVEPEPAPDPEPPAPPAVEPEPEPEPAVEEPEEESAPKSEPAPESDPAAAPPLPDLSRPLVTPPNAEPLPDLPGGRVEGVVAPATPFGDQVIAAVHAEPGITVTELARLLLGSPSGVHVRRVDMTVGPLVMSSKLVRFNGRLYKDMKQAGQLKMPPPLRSPGPKRAERPEPPQPTNEQLFDKIVAAFARNNETPLPKLAEQLFGESNGRAYQKLQLILRQLVASERLERVGAGAYRPIADDERRDEDDEEAETESNGQADGDELQELDLE